MKKQTAIRFLVAVLTLMAVAFFSGRPVQAQDSKAAPKVKSLYDRLGGVYSIATVVDDFIERLLVNDILNANPKIDESRKRLPKAGLKFHVTALVCQLSDGPQVYTGRNMLDTHAQLNISVKEWDAMVADFVACLNHFKVPEKEQGELLALVGPTKKDIVTAK